MTTIAVTGASGFIGRAITSALADTGAHVRAIVRRPHEIPGAAEVRVVPDLGDAFVPQDLFEGVDLVIHLAADVSPALSTVRSEGGPTVAMARVVAERAASAGVSRVLLMSSIAARIAAETPDRARAYGQEKLAAERAMIDRLEPGQTCVILRPPAIYGEGMRGSLATLAALIRKGVPLPFGKGGERIYLARDNLVELISRMAAAGPEAWAAADKRAFVPAETPVDARDLSRRIAEAMGMRVRTVPVPGAILRNAARLVGKQELARSLLDPLLGDDNAELHQLFGWRPALEMNETLQFLRA